jgi:glycosyltransferase involved in cell wall biosynthesis
VSDGKTGVAIIVPCYRSAATVCPLADRLAAAMDAAGRRWCVVFVDDASPDPVRGETWDALLRAKAKHRERVRALRLARNVGQHRAVLCGFGALPEGLGYVATMDDDLQHRPEDLPAMLQALDAGADIVIGAFEDKRHTGWRNLGGKAVDVVLRRLFRLPRGFPLTAFRAMHRSVAEEVAEERGSYVYLTASILAASPRVTYVPVTHEPRRHGRSGYTLARSLVLVANLVLTYSRIPFLLVAGLLGASALLTAGLVAWILIRVLLVGNTLPGWASTMLMIAFHSSTMLVALAILTLYVSRTHRLLSSARAGHRVTDAV